MSYDEQPDGDLHGECAAEIHRLEAEIERLRAALLAHAAQRDHTEDVLGMVQSVELPEPEAIERIATTRYRCVPIRLFGYKVVSGDGDRSLFEGTKDECYVVARKLTEAFLDGAHVAFRQMHQYGDAREAAGYARGRAEQQAVIDRLMMEHCPDEMTTKQRQTWAAAQAQEGGECMVPPLGWRCTRGAGHDGPCAAVAYPDVRALGAEARNCMEENTGGAFYAPDTRNWWRRLLTRLFPAKLVDTPDDADGFAPGYVRSDVHMHLDLRDRLRTLVSGKLRVVVVSQTDVTVAKMRSGSTFWVEAP